MNNAGSFNRQCYCKGAISYDPCTCPYTDRWCTLACFNRDRNRNWQCSGTCRADCFPSTAKVTLENGKSIKMSELQVGDRVQTGTDINTFQMTYKCLQYFSLIHTSVNIYICIKLPQTIWREHKCKEWVIFSFSALMQHPHRNILTQTETNMHTLTPLWMSLYSCGAIQNDYFLAMKVLTNDIILPPVTKLMSIPNLLTLGL